MRSPTQIGSVIVVAMATLQLLIDRGWLMAWWVLVPALAMASIWVLALFNDRRVAQSRHRAPEGDDPSG